MRAGHSGRRAGSAQYPTTARTNPRMIMCVPLLLVVEPVLDGDAYANHSEEADGDAEAHGL